MADFQRTPNYFDCKGINLTLPIDRLPKNKYRLLENTRAYGDGQTQGRQGTDSAVTYQSAITGEVHSLFTLNDPVPSPSSFPTAYKTRARFIGMGTEVWGGQLGAQYGPAWDTGYSGNPLSFVAYPSDFNPRPFLLIADSNKLVKASSAIEAQFPQQYGVSPPNFAPTISLAGGSNPNGPDVGSTGVPYVYAFRAHCDPLTNSGAWGNLGPAVRDNQGLSPTGENISVIVPQMHPDPQVTTLDIFRYGGSLPVWKYVGSIENVAGRGIIDSYNDLAIAANEEALQDDNQPFLTIIPEIKGTADITFNGTGNGSSMVITSGDNFLPYNGTGYGPYMPAGLSIVLGDGNVVSGYRSPDTATTLELFEDYDPFGTGAGTVYTNVDWWCYTPEQVRTPLPCVWGPFGGGDVGTFLFACGDPTNAGTLYWTKGNQAESHPGSNSLILTSASEPLMNGGLFDGRPFVFSNSRAWVIFPTLGQVSDFRAQEIPNSKGLFSRWFLTVTPHGIVFGNKDGIFITSGGEPKSLTDDDLYSIFPHEGTGSSPSSYASVDGLLQASFSPPDFTKPDKLRLAYGDGFLYFDYEDLNGDTKTLVYDFDGQSWVSRDTYYRPARCHYFERVQDDNVPTSNWTQMLMGTTDGYVQNYTGDADWGHGISGQIRSGSWDNQDPRPRKQWGDVEVDLDTTCESIDIKIGMDDFSYFTATNPTGLNYHGRRRVTVDINSGTGQYGYNLGIDITWTTTTGIPVFYFWLPTWLDKPELTALRVTDWDPTEYEGAKFFQGFILHADTLNQTRTIQIQSDGGTPQQTFNVLHPREQEIAYSFTTPFISHMVRMLPTDANFWRQFRDVRWIWEPAPESVANWITQETTHDFRGWWHHRDFYPALISSADATFTVSTGDNSLSPFTYTIPNTNGVYRKLYLPLQPMKCREASYSIVSTDGSGIRLFQKDTELRVKSWGDDQPYSSKMPFGDLSRVSGARI